MQIVIETSFWELFPEARIGVIVARGLDNHTAAPAAEALLADAIQRAAASLDGAEIAAHPDVAPWREAYSRFGAKPSKFRSSIESLLRSAQAGRLRAINPLVDLYNAVSLHHRLPCGGEDLATIEGDVRLTRAAGGEQFVPLGASTSEPPPVGEVIYRDDIGVICRCLNWREADRTKLTETTTNAVLVIEGLPAMAGRVEAASTDLAQLVREQLGAHTEIALLDRAAPVFSFNK